MLFDTTFFIDLADEFKARKFGPCQALLNANRHQNRMVSVVTLGEYAIGASRPEIRRFFRGFQPLALGRELAIFAGRFQSQLPFELGENDLWIAAAAAESDSLLLTTDHDFDHLSPTQLKVWWLDPDATSWPSVPL